MPEQIPSWTWILFSQLPAPSGRVLSEWPFLLPTLLHLEISREPGIQNEPPSNSTSFYKPPTHIPNCKGELKEHVCTHLMRENTIPVIKVEAPQVSTNGQHVVSHIMQYCCVNHGTSDTCHNRNYALRCYRKRDEPVTRWVTLSGSTYIIHRDGKMVTFAFGPGPGRVSPGCRVSTAEDEQVV